jgi:quinol-cytochrome oxidoreductase complex cytochrome b subunit
LKCPGCGSQRAIHFLSNFDIVNAIKENVILVVAIPYLLASSIVDLINRSTGKLVKWRKMLLGKKAIFAILFIVVTFWIARNLA